MRKAVFLLAAALASASCGKEPFPAEPQPEAGAEYRTILKSLDWGQDTVFVYGHKVPDVDAICSSLSFARLMRTLG